MNGRVSYGSDGNILRPQSRATPIAFSPPLDISNTLPPLFSADRRMTRHCDFSLTTTVGSTRQIPFRADLHMGPCGGEFVVAVWQLSEDSRRRRRMVPLGDASSSRRVGLHDRGRRELR